MVGSNVNELLNTREATDCIGEWSTCTVDCTKTYTITTEASGGGNPCPNVNNETADCVAGEGECPLITQQDQESSVTTARETTETVSSLQASLSTDPTNETLQEELRTAVQTQTEAIQSTNTVIQESIAGEGNAIQEEIQRVTTARENVDQARDAYENASEEDRGTARSLLDAAIVAEELLFTSASTVGTSAISRATGLVSTATDAVNTATEAVTAVQSFRDAIFGDSESSEEESSP